MELRFGSKRLQKCCPMRMRGIDRQRAVQRIVDEIERIIERQPPRRRIEQCRRSVCLALPIASVAESATGRSILIVGKSPMVFRVRLKRPFFIENRAQSHLSESHLFVEPLVVLIRVVMHDSRQSAVVVVVVELGRKIVFCIDAPKQIQFAAPRVHSAVRAPFSRRQRHVFQRERIVVVGVEERARGREREFF